MLDNLALARNEITGDNLESVFFDDAADNREIAFFDDTGDTRIRWSRASDHIMRTVIQSLMDEGHSFFVVEYEAGGQVEIEKPISDLGVLKERSVIVKNDTLRALYESGGLKIIKSNAFTSLMEGIRRLVSPDDVAEVFAKAAKPEPVEQSTAAERPASTPVRTRTVMCMRPIAGG